MAELRCGHVDQKQNEDPERYGGKAMPREGRDEVRSEIARPIAFPQEMDEALEQAREKHDDPVKRRLEQDRLDQRRPVVASQKGYFIGDEHGLADNKSRHRR